MELEVLGRRAPPPLCVTESVRNCMMGLEMRVDRRVELVFVCAVVSEETEEVQEVKEVKEVEELKDGKAACTPGPFLQQSQTQD